MKQLTRPAALFALLAIQACSSTPPEQSEVTPNPERTQATLDNPASIKMQTFILRGEVVLGPDVSSLTPCDSNNQYWLDLSPELKQQARAVAHQPYQALYGEVIGYLTPPSQTGFNGDYTARFVVQQINQLSSENPQRCQHPPRPTRAFGTEPFWSIQFTPQGLEFQPLGGDKQHFMIENSQLSTQQRHYQFPEGKLSLVRAVCSDNMSDTLYSWRSTLTLSATTYQGCATLSNVDTTQTWAGTYFASASDQRGFGVTLELNADHSAITRYRYLSGERELVEKGYWQQLNPKQVQVVMTHHQQQYLLSERIYTRDGFQLHADKEKIGHQVYPISEGGLTLFQAKSVADQQTSLNQRNLDDHPQSISSRGDYDEQVDQAIKRYFALHKTDPSHIHYRWLKYDLNGNQTPELLVQLDWCQQEQCTLLIFEQKAGEWRFNSRINQVATPFQLGKLAHHGWQDLILTLRRDQQTQHYQLPYNGISYPATTRDAQPAQTTQISGVTLFADGLAPSSGVKL